MKRWGTGPAGVEEGELPNLHIPQSQHSSQGTDTPPAPLGRPPTAESDTGPVPRRCRQGALPASRCVCACSGQTLRAQPCSTWGKTRSFKMGWGADFKE